MSHATPRQAVFLVGGKGSRLGDAVRDLPKPLLPVAGRPFLDHLLDRAVAAGCTDLLLLTGQLGELVAERYDDRAWAGARVRCRQEATPLGTGGAVRAALDALEESFLLFNGDSLLTVDLARLAAALTETVEMALAVVRVDDGGRYGTVQVDNGRAIRFAEKSADAGPGLINGGVYAVRRRAVARLPEGPSSLEHDLLTPLAAAGRLAACPADGPFIDIGTPDDLARADAVVSAIAPLIPTPSAGKGAAQ
ncbi:nucleotidyltransferase family protein [Roseospirillum parvum]|uniref:D-glycero-D-manno-heptose 1,7-bisphosphate phosphatase n=1 Tax=Roseospirillum parvum TaxID=83401 RepID=A0A1G7TW87_9PROT|nr:nucleotidyltransferase family protein [Roseospirillum parvum]SDG39304.1 D-glycero-D-manno-heptose 1,7-bisphosphate phosphatase [Roseospirillum parvum]